MTEGLKAYYGLPERVTFCRRCVISNQRPSSTVEFRSTAEARKTTIAFDEAGVCAACRYADMKQHEIDWQAREAALVALCAQYRSKAVNVLSFPPLPGITQS